MDQIVEFFTNHVILSSVWVALVVLLVYSFVSSSLSPVKELSTQDATLLMNREEALVLDIRPTAEFNKGHILGATQLKAEQISQANFTQLEKNKDKPIIVVCAMGMSARKTAMQMLKAGFTQAAVLKGGMNAWQGGNLPINKG